MREIIKAEEGEWNNNCRQWCIYVYDGRTVKLEVGFEYRQ